MLFVQLFQKMFPSEEFFPKSTSPSEDVDDGAPELESHNSENLAADEAEVELES